MIGCLIGEGGANMISKEAKETATVHMDRKKTIDRKESADTLAKVYTPRKPTQPLCQVGSTAAIKG